MFPNIAPGRRPPSSHARVNAERKGKRGPLSARDSVQRCAVDAALSSGRVQELGGTSGRQRRGFLSTSSRPDNAARPSTLVRRHPQPAAINKRTSTPAPANEGTLHQQVERGWRRRRRSRQSRFAKRATAREQPGNFLLGGGRSRRPLADRTSTAEKLKRKLKRTIAPAGGRRALTRA